MLPSMHARWSEDTSGGPSSYQGSPFAPMMNRVGMGTSQRVSPMLPSRQRLSGGGGPSLMTPTPQAPEPAPATVPGQLMRRMV